MFVGRRVDGVVGVLLGLCLFAFLWSINEEGIHVWRAIRMRMTVCCNIEI